MRKLKLMFFTHADGTWSMACDTAFENVTSSEEEKGNPDLWHSGMELFVVFTSVPPSGLRVPAHLTSKPAAEQVSGIAS